MAILKFETNASPSKKAIVVCFDAGGFSKFCNHPDRSDYIPRFISAVFELFDTFTISQTQYDFSSISVDEPKIVAPDFIKYTGDGAILIWVAETKDRFNEEFRTLLVATMRRFQKEFSQVVSKWESNWCITEIPQSIRFGISMGSISPLRAQSLIFEGNILDYAGYCINLAVRLQSHCREIGFVVQKCVAPNLPHLKGFSALGMKGTLEEPVWIFESDLEIMKNNPRYFQTKFRQL